MDIVKADFDWISLLLVVGAGVIGLIKSASKKTPPAPGRIPPPYTTEANEDETVEWHTDTVSYKPETIQTMEEEIPLSDYYKKPEKETADTNTILFNPDQETEQENRFQLDIRQAIISSEILRRPEY